MGGFMSFAQRPDHHLKEEAVSDGVHDGQSAAAAAASVVEEGEGELVPVVPGGDRPRRRPRACCTEEDGPGGATVAAQRLPFLPLEPLSASDHLVELLLEHLANFEVEGVASLIQSSTGAEAEVIRQIGPAGFKNRGLAHAKNQEHDLAIANYTEAIRLKPDYDAAFLLRGIAHQKNQNYDLAVADYTAAIRLKPGDQVAFFSRGSAHQKNQDYDQAIADYTEAIHLKPDDHVAFCNRGDAHQKKQEYERALADYSEAIRLPPHAAGFRHRGLYFLHRGLLELAGADLHEAVRLQPKNPKFRNSRALWHLSMENYSKALEDLDLAVSHSVTPSWVRISNRARALLCLGEVEQALPLFETALNVLRKTSARGRRRDSLDILYVEFERAMALLHLRRRTQVNASLKILDEDDDWEIVALAMSFQANCLWADESKAKSDWACIVRATRRHELVGSVDDCLSYAIRLKDQLELLFQEDRKDLSPYLIVLKYLWNEDPSREQARLVKSVQWFVGLFDAELDFAKKAMRLDILQELIARFVARRSLTIECSYVKACHAFVEEGLRIPKHWFDHTESQCYCEDCLRGQTIPRVRVEPQGASADVSRRCSYPSGWVKFGLPVSPNDRGGAKNVFQEWCQAYHGTLGTSVKAILHCGTLLRAGDVTRSGHQLQVAPGHISYKDQSDPALRAELKSFVRSRFVSPSLKYASIYGRKTNFRGRGFQIVFEVRIDPGTFKDSLPSNTPFFDPGQLHTLPPSSGFDDPLFPGECLEWFTDREGVIVLTGMMVKMTGGPRGPAEAEEEEEGEVVPVASTSPSSSERREQLLSAAASNLTAEPSVENADDSVVNDAIPEAEDPPTDVREGPLLQHLEDD